jgi:CDP-diacylglycerol---serine O-phosphatidyltransferase
MGKRLHSKRLRSIAMLPTLLTLGNLLCGFAAIHFVAKYLAGVDVFSAGHARVERWLPTHLAIAGYLLFLSMVFDALDGRVARMMRKTSDFGAQMDSLADVVSFGVAPAFLLIGLVSKALIGDAQVSPISDLITGRIVWIVAAIYVCCGALRLARFNVENVHDESSHIWFKGLPIPGAASVVASLVILHEEVLRRNQDSTFGDALLWAMPVITLAVGLLMVSRIRYAHIINRYLRGRGPLGRVFWFLSLLAAFIVYPQMVLAVITVAYAASGPVGAVYRWFVPLPAAEAPLAEEAPQDRPGDVSQPALFRRAGDGSRE